MRLNLQILVSPPHSHVALWTHTEIKGASFKPSIATHNGNVRACLFRLACNRRLACAVKIFIHPLVSWCCNSSNRKRFSCPKRNRWHPTALACIAIGCNRAGVGSRKILEQELLHKFLVLASEHSTAHCSRKTEHVTNVMLGNLLGGRRGIWPFQLRKQTSTTHEPLPPAIASWTRAGLINGTRILRWTQGIGSRMTAALLPTAFRLRSRGIQPQLASGNKSGTKTSCSSREHAIKHVDSKAHAHYQI